MFSNSVEISPSGFQSHGRVPSVKHVPFLKPLSIFMKGLHFSICSSHINCLGNLHSFPLHRFNHMKGMLKWNVQFILYRLSNDNKSILRPHHHSFRPSVSQIISNASLWLFVLFQHLPIHIDFLFLQWHQQFYVLRCVQIYQMFTKK